jgi:alpha-1,2-glucosyltransferase
MGSQDHDTTRLVRIISSLDHAISIDERRYLIAKLFAPIFGCDTASLRRLNVVALGLICPLCYYILRMLRARLPGHTDGNTDKKIRSDNDATMKIDAHAAFNIALFPPLFFFSALFYTDVMSTLVVLLSYSIFLKKTTVSGTVFDNFGAVFVGVLALLFRQTNIFWVAVFPAGISVIEALKASASPWEGPIPSTTGGILQYSWSTGVIHDCAVQDGSLRGSSWRTTASPIALTSQDYILLVLTLVAAALRNPFAVLRTAFPYISLLWFFTGFVVWNGSVVLGRIF